MRERRGVRREGEHREELSERGRQEGRAEEEKDSLLIRDGKGAFCRNYYFISPKINLSTYESRFGFGKPWCLVLDQRRWQLVT